MVQIVPPHILSELRQADSAEALMTAAYHWVRNIQDKPKNETWVAGTLDTLKFFQTIETVTPNIKAMILALYERAWNDIPPDVRQPLGITFTDFAMKFSNREVATLNNYLRVARWWFLEEETTKRLPSHVDIPETKNGRLVLRPNGEPVINRVPFEPHLIPHSKLLVATRQLHEDKLKPNHFAMLADSSFTRDDIVKHLNDSAIASNDLPVYYIEGPFLVIARGGEEKVFANLNWEEYDHELVREAINRILDVLNIDRDEDAIDRIQRRAGQYTVVAGKVIKPNDM
jgi:hypothetical protein